LKGIRKGGVFTINDVTYRIEKVFKSNGLNGYGVIVRMTRYLIKNENTVFVHNCPAKKLHMERMTPETIDQMKKKWGKKTIDSWVREGRVKFKTEAIQTVCPNCKCVFYKKKNLRPEKVYVEKVLDNE
jgi:hypothetical protein